MKSDHNGDPPLSWLLWWSACSALTPSQSDNRGSRRSRRWKRWALNVFPDSSVDAVLGAGSQFCWGVSGKKWKPSSRLWTPKGPMTFIICSFSLNGGKTIKILFRFLGAAHLERLFSAERRKIRFSTLSYCIFSGVLGVWDCKKYSISPITIQSILKSLASGNNGFSQNIFYLSVFRSYTRWRFCGRRWSWAATRLWEKETRKDNCNLCRWSTRWRRRGCWRAPRTRSSSAWGACNNLLEDKVL